MKQTLLFILACLLTTGLKAQDSLKTGNSARRSYGKVGLSYLSNSVYNGRKDSVAIPYLTMSLGYYNRFGFYVKTSVSYLAKAGEGRIDVYDFAGGYNWAKGNWEASAGGYAAVYNSASNNLKSTQSGGFSVYSAYDFGFIKPGLDAGINLGAATDFSLALSLEHSFELLHSDLEITPVLLVNTGTQNYYGEYYSSRNYGRKRKKNTGITYTASVNTSNTSKFSIQDVELSLPVDYYFGCFRLSFVANYAIPFNPASVQIQLTGSDGSTTHEKLIKESLGNSFYFSAGISYKLQSKLRSNR